MTQGALVVLLAACSSAPAETAPSTTGGERVEADDRSPTFAEDLAFLREHLSDLVVLSRGEARVVVAPAYQGRVMTSGVAVDGASFGWIHRARIESGIETPHMNAFGGEDRFWLGPEGGPFALYFPPGAPLDFEHWQVPAAIDTAAWDVVAQDETSVSFRHEATFVNRRGTELSVRIDRAVTVEAPWVDAPGARAVAYASVNTITNTGAAA